MLISSHLSKYKQTIIRLPEDVQLSKGTVLAGDLLMERSGQLEMYYAPHNEVINPAAKIMIVGITPGWTQMSLALKSAQEGLKAGLTDEAVCRQAKEAAGFAGPMRTHLLDMLDTLELPQYLGIRSSAELFMEHRGLLHTTSLLRYPVFAAGKNYNGTHPGLLTDSFLKPKAVLSLREELSFMDEPLIIPLGIRVEQVLQLLVQDGVLNTGRCLWGFPHPSGANGHRQKQFAGNKESMRDQIRSVYRG